MKTKFRLFFLSFSVVLIMGGLCIMLWLVNARSQQASVYFEQQTVFALETAEDGQRSFTVFGRTYELPRLSNEK